MPGELDPIYLAARRALLDAIEALQHHIEAVVLVGAQAIYLHTGEGDLAVAPYTTDGDFVLAPSDLPDAPLLAEALSGAHFTPNKQPGSWRSAEGVVIDIMVPAALGGPGSRGARLGAHGNRAARKARGLEAALVDRSKMRINSFEPGDPRNFEIWVAGPAALLIAKLHKLGERAHQPTRRDNKDALDILRILRQIPTRDLAEATKRLLADPFSAEVTSAALSILQSLFATPDADGCQMAVKATEGLEDPEEISRSCALLAADLLAASPHR